MRSVVMLAFTLLPLALAQPAAAQPAISVDAGYAVYTAGLNSLRLETRAALSDAGYQAEFDVHTAGFYGALFHGEDKTLVEGRWNGIAPVPLHFDSSGVWSGQVRHTVIDYPDGEPVVRTLVPSNESERDPIPPELARDSMDTVSAMLFLVRLVARTGRCDGHARVFDGRHVVEMTVRTVGTETLEHSSRSPYAGTTVRCDFEGVQIAGFYRDADQADLRRPKRGSAWLAQVMPGAPAMPVRVSFQLRWLGQAMIYLTALHENGPFTASGAPSAAPR